MIFKTAFLVLISTLLFVNLAESKCECHHVFSFGSGNKMSCSCTTDDEVKKEHVTSIANEAGINTDDNVQNDDSGRLGDGGPSASMEMAIVMRNQNIKGISRDTFDVPKLLGHVTELNLHGNRISHVDSTVFSKLMRLKKLDLGDNEIENIEDFSFKQLSELKYLNMQSNNINSVNMQMFVGLSELERLDLRTNEIENLGFLPFMELSELKYLDLSENMIQELDKFHFMSTGELMVLSLRHNEIVKIGEETFGFLKSLQILDLSANQLTEIDENTFNGLFNLKLLNLNGNMIDSIRGKPFRQMRHLTELNLAGNQLRSFPPIAFHGFPDLHYIDLSHNRFEEATYIPVALGNEEQKQLIQNVKFMCSEDLRKDSPRVFVNMMENNLKFLFGRLSSEDIGFDYSSGQSHCSF